MKPLILSKWGSSLCVRDSHLVADGKSCEARRLSFSAVELYTCKENLLT